MENKEEVEKLKQEVNILKNYLNPVQIKEAEHKHQKEMLELLFTVGGEFFLNMKEKQANTDSEQMKYEFELEQTKLKSIEQLDKREKNFKLVLLSLCIIALVISVAFLAKSEIIVPVISLIIGLLFKSNSFSEYLKYSSKNNSEMDGEA